MTITLKRILLALPLIGLAIAIVRMSSNSNHIAAANTQVEEKASQIGLRKVNENAQAENPLTTEVNSVADFKLLSGQASPQKTYILPGVFRGEWGEVPVYTTNDRVNYERGAYLSLVNGNENQPPATSPGYWRLVKKFKELHEENCFDPAAGIDMAECDFTNAGSLKDLNLQGAVLTKSRLNGELGAADLTDANLSGAVVLGSLVISPDTRLENANLSYLQSDGNNPVIAENANLAKVNFTKANLYGAKMSHADLNGAKLPEAVLTGSQLVSTHFDDADLSKSDMTYSNLSESTLTHATMAEANLEQADLSRADFSQTNLQQANLAGAQLGDVNFSGANLHGVNLSDAQHADTAIIDNQTDFTSAICPDGVIVDGTRVTTCVGHGF